MNYSRLSIWPQVYVGDTFDEIFATAVHDIFEYPQYICEPRGQKVKEALAVNLVLTNPRARLLASKARDTQYGFGCGEFLWYWAGKNDLETMLYYNKRMKDFSDDGKTLNSAYGYRVLKSPYIFNNEKSSGPFGEDEWQNTWKSQWDAAKATLLSDPDSRRAVALIGLPEDYVRSAGIGTKDAPCTLSLQFFIREGKLDLHVHMRSNDVVWGLTYDLFSFTLMQELMMEELRTMDPKFLNLELGCYYHTAGSLHIYERHFDMAQRIVSEYVEERPTAAPMEPVDLNEMGSLVDYEKQLRERKVEPNGSNRFSGGCRWIAEQLEAHRRKRDAERGG